MDRAKSAAPPKLCKQPHYDHGKILHCQKMPLHISDEHQHTTINPDGSKVIIVWRD